MHTWVAWPPAKSRKRTKYPSRWIAVAVARSGPAGNGPGSVSVPVMSARTARRGPGRSGLREARFAADADAGTRPFGCRAVARPVSTVKRADVIREWDIEQPLRTWESSR